MRKITILLLLLLPACNTNDFEEEPYVLVYAKVLTVDFENQRILIGEMVPHIMPEEFSELTEVNLKFRNEHDFDYLKSFLNKRTLIGFDADTVYVHYN